MYYVLYNALSANKQGLEHSRLMLGNEVPEDAKMIDITSITSYADFWASIDLENDTVILSGGDGTINRFVNENVGLTLPKNLFYFAAGSGNDFKKDVSDDSSALISLHKYIQNLPPVTVNGKISYFIKYLFLNHYRT